MRDLKVIYTNSDGNIRPGFENTPSIINETDVITQKFYINLNTLLGSNAFLRNKGNNFFPVIGGNFNKKDDQKVKTILSLAIDQTTSQIINEQNLDYTIPDYQRLAKVEIVSIIYDNSTNSWFISLQMIMANNSTINFRI